MQVRVLGCSTSELPNVNLSSFLVDNRILLDAGNILSALDENERLNIKNILVSHAHLDHIQDIPFFAESLLIAGKKLQITVTSIPQVTQALKDNIFNDVVWPDYTKIPAPEKPTIRFENVDAGKSFHIDDYKITAYKVNHTVPAVGYLIEDGAGKRLLYAGDTGPCTSIWNSLNNKRIHGLIIEVSFPDKEMELAIKTRHLTPALLMSELRKMEHLPDNIFITHCKPQFKKEVEEELKNLDIRNVRMLSCGARFEI